VVNQIRSLLLERGLTLPKGRSHVDALLPRILENAELNLSGSFRVLLAQLQVELDQLTGRIEQMDSVIQQKAREDEACQRLTEIPGVGPVTATALVAAIGNGAAFRKGRALAAWVGMVPRECSTGGKQKLLGISKRGNAYLRTGRAPRATTATQAGSRPPCLVRATAGAHAPECSHRCFGQQTGSHGLGGLMQKRTLSRSGAGCGCINPCLRNRVPARSAGEK
jgi:transposase